MTYRALRAVKTKLKELTLHDTWRTLLPNDREFTFYSSPHDKYSRIDHFFLSQNDLSFLSKASIDPMVLSGHNPISMMLTLQTTHTRPTIWRLDNSLLTDIKTTEHILHYFKEKDTIDSTPANIWAAHKCAIRGELISLAKQTKLRKDKECKEDADANLYNQNRL